MQKRKQCPGCNDYFLPGSSHPCRGKKGAQVHYESILERGSSERKLPQLKAKDTNASQQGEYATEGQFQSTSTSDDGGTLLAVGVVIGTLLG